MYSRIALADFEFLVQRLDDWVSRNRQNESACDPLPKEKLELEARLSDLFQSPSLTQRGNKYIPGKLSFKRATDIGSGCAEADQSEFALQVLSSALLHSKPLPSAYLWYLIQHLPSISSHG
jgi:hypothetical protein